MAPTMRARTTPALAALATHCRARTPTRRLQGAVIILLPIALSDFAR